MSQQAQQVRTLVKASDTFITIGQEITVGASYDPLKIINQLPITLNRETIEQFIQQIASTFTADRLKWVCAMANIDEAVLAGCNSLDQARNLVDYASRHQNDLYELLRACENESGHTNWPRWRELYSKNPSIEGIL